MIRFASVGFLLMVACGTVVEPTSAGVTGTVQQAVDRVDAGYGSNPANLLMYRFVPAGLPRNRPLVVLLHGCGETASSFSTGSGFEAQATQRQFALLVPQQQASNNLQTCFNWFDSANQARGSGELASITQMIDRMVADLGSDPQQVFVAGFSAGGAAAANLLAAYPDRFKAGVIAAGIPYKCTETFLGSTACLSGANESPAVWGMRARSGFPTFSGPWPRVAVWQGLADVFVAPANRVELVEQWTNVHGVDQTADGTTPISSGGTRSFYRATPTGNALVELDEVPGQGHAWRSAWATDMADFFGLSAPTTADGGTAAGGSSGGAAGGSSGGVAGGSSGGVAGGSSGGAAGGSSGGAAGGSSGGAAGGSNASGGGVAGGSNVAGGSANTAGGTGNAAGGLAPVAGGGGGGLTTAPAAGCGSCNSASGLCLVALGAWLSRRRFPR